MKEKLNFTPIHVGLAGMWSAVTCHRFGGLGDLSPKHGRVQRSGSAPNALAPATATSRLPKARTSPRTPKHADSTSQRPAGFRPRLTSPSRQRHSTAFTRAELLAVIGALALLMVMAVAAQSRPREYGQRVTCMNNLRQIARGWLMWAGEHGGSGPPGVNAVDGGTKSNQNIYAPFLVASNEIGSPRVLVCPSDAVQQIAGDWKQFDSPPFRNNAVSYFAGMHVSDPGNPALLAGDPNLVGASASSCAVAQIRVASFDYQRNTLSWGNGTFHQDAGNIAFADGQIRQLTSDGLRKLSVPVFNDGGNYEHLLLPP